MDKRVRKIIIGLIMFLSTSLLMFAINWDRSFHLLTRGGLMGIIVFPLAHQKFERVKYKRN